jgi:hypothetical protein
MEKAIRERERGLDGEFLGRSITTTIVPWRDKIFDSKPILGRKLMK